MDSEKVELQAFIFGMSSVLKLSHRKGKLPAPLPKLVAAAISAYWENGSYEGFRKIMSERIVDVAIKETRMLAEIPDRLYSEKDHAAFLEALYQEVYSFFELCFMDDYRYLARSFYTGDSIMVVFARKPCTVTYIETGPFTGVYKVSTTEIKEDEK